MRPCRLDILWQILIECPPTSSARVNSLRNSGIPVAEGRHAEPHTDRTRALISNGHLRQRQIARGRLRTATTTQRRARWRPYILANLCMALHNPNKMLGWHYDK